MLIVKTPLRISFAGGGSDLKTYYSKKPGEVVSATINKYIYVIIKKRFDQKIYINYSKKECVSNVNQIKHDLVREAMVKTGVLNGVEITTLADIPSSGSGLGSSSAVTVGLLHALYSYKNELVSSERLAREACEIEIDILNNPIGKQDQYAVAFGGINNFIFNKNGSVTRKPIKIDDNLSSKFSSSLFLYYTGISRSSKSILKDQKKATNRKDKFKVMTDMVNLVEQFIESISNGDIKNCGSLLDKNWELKKQMASGITNQKINEFYNFSQRAGAIGGKISGAGGGGFLLVIVPRDKQNNFFSKMSKYRELPFNIEPRGSSVIFDYRSNSYQ